MTFDLEASLEAQRVRQHAEGAVKTWEDLTRYKTIIERTDPTVVIECGSFSGKSALWLSGVELGGPEPCVLPPPQRRVITIDVDPVPVEVQAMWPADVTAIVGSSTDPATIATVRAGLRDDDRVMVILDSRHDAPHVALELGLYAWFVTPGCYCVVEDTIVRWIPGLCDGSPLDAVEQWVAAHPEWENDTGIDDMFPVTQHHGGWLRRIP